MQWFTDSLIHYFIYSLGRWTIDLSVDLFVDSWFCWFIELLNQWSTDSCVHWFVDLLIHRDPLIHWFVESLIHLFIQCDVHGFFYIIVISTTMLMHLTTSTTHCFCVARAFLFVMDFISYNHCIICRNFRPGMGQEIRENWPWGHKCIVAFSPPWPWNQEMYRPIPATCMFPVPI